MGFFRRSQSSSVQYSCSRQSNCPIDRASRNRCQSCRLKKCVAQGMSRDAVKFGRMSKRQRDSLFAEVERHRQQHLQTNSDQDLQHLSTYRSVKESRDQAHLIPSLPPGYQYSVETELSADVHPFLDCRIGQSQVQSLACRASHRRELNCSRTTPETILGMNGSELGFRGVDPESAFLPFPTALHIGKKHLEEISACIVRSHKETTQFQAEELQALRWKVFSREESVDEMWQYCAVRLTDAVQYVVEFAKHIPGFRQLCQNDQIALLKSDRPCLEDRERVQRVRRDVELALTHILHRDLQGSLLPKLYQRIPVLKSLCMQHIEKLCWFRQLFPITVISLFPPLYKELFGSDTDGHTLSTQ
ncbi:hypothetical protein DNTS_001108 [Danionella cerebrum]|uniref:NR LBD domain-containing protein n=1 Tax=Danionella cerebrum TaxID=2873325 RepID=A0A553Q985_9TELE|nr:hypothetical protein DNTS_001108 [Danionella translucida]